MTHEDTRYSEFNWNDPITRRQMLSLLWLSIVGGTAAACAPAPQAVDNDGGNAGALLAVPRNDVPQNTDSDGAYLVVKSSIQDVVTPQEMQGALLVVAGVNERGNLLNVQAADGSAVQMVKNIPTVDLPIKNPDARLFSPTYAWPSWMIPTFRPFANLAYGASLSQEKYGPLAYNHDPRFILGLAAVESGGKTDAVSSAGARGWTQFMPGTWTSHMNVLRNKAKKDELFRRFLIDMTGEDILSIQGEPNPFHPGWGVVASNEYVLNLLPQGPIPSGSIADPRTGRYTPELENYVRAAQNAAYKYWKGKGAPDGDRTSVYERYIGDWVGAIGSGTRPKLLSELISTRVYDRGGGVNTVINSINKWAPLYGFDPLQAAKLLQDLKSV